VTPVSHSVIVSENLRESSKLHENPVHYCHLWIIRCRVILYITHLVADLPLTKCHSSRSALLGTSLYLRRIIGLPGLHGDGEARKRANAGVKSQDNPTDNCPEGRGETRNVLGAMIGVSGKTLDC